ncbi:MAG: heme A synthase [Actinobacteria bacterium]|nr:MAG: heme A synthase [Actinomycetota bacterium]
MPRLARYGWFTLIFNVGVILLGALVRATGSGAGCGDSWPTCEGEIIPELSGDTAIEFLHRSASGVALVLVFVFAVMVWRAFPAGEPARTGAVVSVLAIVGEALIGAMIVLSRWVADDDSVARAVAVPLHLVNTFLLLGALTLTIHWVSGGRRLDTVSHRSTWRWLLLGAAAIVLISATGAITALADTLFPKDGIGLDLEAGSHFLSRLRVIHPILAVVVAIIAWWKVGGSVRSGDARLIVWLVGAMLISGVANVALGVPVWMQLVHLALADSLWIAYVLMGARAIGSDRPLRAGALVPE